MSSLILLDKTAAKFAKGHQNVSWSKIDQYRNCKRRWFMTNFADFGIDVQEHAIRDSVKAVPGTIIQKLFEIYINDKKYALPNEELELWLDINLYWLYHTMKYGIEDSARFPFDTRNYDKSEEGILRIQKALANGADPAVLKKVNPKFFNPEDLQYGMGESQFLELMRTVLRTNIRIFHEKMPIFSKLHSEMFIRAKFMNSLTCNGGVDFMYNPNGPFAFENKDGEPKKGYQIFDGKWNYNKFTKVDQLQFYAFIYFSRYRVFPEKLGFIEWISGDWIEVPLDMARIDKIKNTLYAINTVQKKIKVEIDEIISRRIQTIDFHELKEVPASPSDSACIFCDIKSSCKDAYVPNSNGTPVEETQFTEVWAAENPFAS